MNLDLVFPLPAAVYGEESTIILLEPDKGKVKKKTRIGNDNLPEVPESDGFVQGPGEKGVVHWVHAERHHFLHNSQGWILKKTVDNLDESPS